MPAGDRTGPIGLGPMTGRRRGYCADDYTAGSFSGFFGRRFGYGRGYGYGRGFGYGRGHGFGWRSDYDYPDYRRPVDDKTVLENDIKDLKEQLAYMEKELSKYKDES